MLPITVCLISKNESSHIIPCLSRLRPHFPEIILVDTGSTDNTVALARPYADRLLTFDWKDDFSAARNYAVSYAGNDWVLHVDCDEYLESIEEQELNRLLCLYPQSIGMFTLINPCMSFGAVTTHTERMGRLFSKSYYHYEGTIHEQPAALSGAACSYFEIPLSFHHQGYATEAIVQQKAARNLSLLLKAFQPAAPDPYLCFQIGQSFLLLKDYEKACHYFDMGLSIDVNPHLEYVRTMVESYGYCLLELKQYQTALQFEGIYDTFCDRADFVFLMGLIYMNNAMFENAISEFQKASHMSAASTEGVNSYLAHYNTGVIYECLGNNTEALHCYKKCGHYPPAAERIILLSDPL